MSILEAVSVVNNIRSVISRSETERSLTQHYEENKVENMTYIIYNLHRI